MKKRTTITFQCPPELKKRIEEEAQKDRRNTSQWLVKWLEDNLMGQPAPMLTSLPEPRRPSRVETK
jgi:hypothetical protein